MKNKFNIILSSVEPKDKTLDAVTQEAYGLKEMLNGTIFNIYPFNKPSSLLPTYLYKRNLPKDINKEDRINILFHPSLRKFNVLKKAKGKFVYVASTCLWLQKPQYFDFYNKYIDLLIVNNDRDYEVTKRYLNTPVIKVTPGVDPKGIVKTTNPRNGPLKVLVASAPWTKQQIKTKGLKTLFDLISIRDDIHLTLLLRGYLASNIESLINKYGISDKVRLINKSIDIKDYVQKADVVFLVAKSHGIVKSIPHSLVEACYAGVPIITNELISFSSVVKKNKLGKVIESVNKESMNVAFNSIIANYEIFKNQAISYDPVHYIESRYLDDMKNALFNIFNIEK